MNKFSIFLQILSKNMFKPKNIVNLVKERVEVQDDVKHKVHEYEYDYNSIKEFFKDKFPDVDLIQYELELNEIETHVNNFLTKYGTSDLIGDNMADFKTEFRGIVSTLNLRIESEGGGL